jgi:CheY-like chemotaxis protein
MDIVTGEDVRSDLSRVKVLLVDDDKGMHELMSLFLGKTEFSLVSVTNAPDAMALINNDPPDILITDAIMPGESGFSLIEKVKGSPSTAKIPVILWTILETPSGAVLDASGKADILMNKPFYHCDIMGGLQKAKSMIRSSRMPNDIPVYMDQSTLEQSSTRSTTT